MPGECTKRVGQGRPEVTPRQLGPPDAVINMVVTSLNATVYVDDFALR